MFQTMRYAVFKVPASPLCKLQADSSEEELDALSLAIENKEFAQNLLSSLASDQQSANKLMLACAIMEFQTLGSFNSGKANQISHLFLRKESPFRVKGIPSHLTRMNSTENLEIINGFILQELLAHPTVISAMLHLKQTQCEVPSHSIRRRRKTSIWLQTAKKIRKNTDPAINRDLKTIAHLEETIHGCQSRCQLIQLLLACGDSTVLAQIRFVGAVDQLMECTHDALKQQHLNRSIRTVFQDKGMFALPSVSRLIQTGQLEQARIQCLEELNLRDDVRVALGKLGELEAGEW